MSRLAKPHSIQQARSHIQSYCSRNVKCAPQRWQTKGNAAHLATAQVIYSLTSYAQADLYCATRHPDSITEPFIIGVAGGSASGKTSVCQKILQELQLCDLEHQGILCVSQDCFYRNLKEHERADIANFNFDHPDAFSFDETVDTLRCLKQGKPAEVPIYDFVSSSRLSATTTVPQADVILFDGILAFYTEELRDLFDVKIFVDTDADTRLARRIKRDIVERGRDIMQVLNQYEKTVKPSFESYILPTKKHADLIVPRGVDNLVAVDIIIEHIRSKLAKRKPKSSVSLV